MVVNGIWFGVMTPTQLNTAVDSKLIPHLLLLHVEVVLLEVILLLKLLKQLLLLGIQACLKQTGSISLVAKTNNFN